MRRRSSGLAVLVISTLLAGAGPLLAEENPSPVATWPQFLGPGGTGLGDDDAVVPTEFGPSKALLWKTDLPSGYGSPCVWGERIFVTAFDESAQKLEVMAINRTDGDIAWRRTVATEDLEKVHAVSSPATSTPVTDGTRVYVYFGSFGLLAYEWDGTLAWKHPMGVSTSPFGSGASPMLTGELVVVTRDYTPEPYMLAVNRADGAPAWKTTFVPSNYPGPNASHATPALWKDQIVLHRPGAVSAFSPADGKRLWRLATASQGTSTPSPTGEALYVTANGGGIDPANFQEIPPYAALLSRYDANGDGRLELEELPDEDVYVTRRAGMPDGIPGAHFTMKLALSLGFGKVTEDGFVEEAGYDHLVATLGEWGAPTSSFGLLAIHPGADGDLSETVVKWTYERNVPEVPAPLVYRGRVYMILNGGIVTSVKADSGERLYRGRVNARGAYYASPVAAGGKIFVASAEGVVSVLGHGDTLEVLANNDLGDPVYGTPAPVGSALYVRSASHLWAFGADSSED